MLINKSKHHEIRQETFEYNLLGTLTRPTDARTQCGLHAGKPLDLRRKELTSCAKLDWCCAKLDWMLREARLADFLQTCQENSQ